MLKQNLALCTITEVISWTPRLVSANRTHFIEMHDNLGLSLERYCTIGLQVNLSP